MLGAGSLGNRAMQRTKTGPTDGGGGKWVLLSYVVREREARSFLRVAQFPSRHEAF